MKAIPLTKGMIATVDDSDYEWLSKFKWCANWNEHSKSYYAVRNSGKENKYKKQYMHRLIMNAKPDEQVDYIHHNTLDNRREELRICDNSQNNINQGMNKSNTSGYRGVSWNKKVKKWDAYITCNKKHIHVGTYSDIVDAAEAYNKKALELFNEFAYQNKIEKGEKKDD